MSSILPTHCKACHATIFVKVFFSFIIKFALSENEHHFSRRPIKSRIDLARHTHTRFVSNGKHEHKLVHGTENDCCSNGYVAHSKHKGKWFEPSESVGFTSVSKFKYFLNINADRFEYLVQDCRNDSLYQSCSFCEPGYGIRRIFKKNSKKGFSYGYMVVFRNDAVLNQFGVISSHTSQNRWNNFEVFLGLFRSFSGHFRSFLAFLMTLLQNHKGVNLPGMVLRQRRHFLQPRTQRMHSKRNTARFLEMPFLYKWLRING